MEEPAALLAIGDTVDSIKSKRFRFYYDACNGLHFTSGGTLTDSDSLAPYC